MTTTPFHLHTLRSGQEVLIHTGHPAFVATVTPNADGSIDIRSVYWLEPPPNDAHKLAAIMRRVGDWYAAQK